MSTGSSSPETMADEEDVDEGLVVGDHHIGVAWVLRERTLDLELPQWIQLLVDDCRLPEDETRPVSGRVEGGCHHPGERHDRQGHQHADAEYEPRPDRPECQRQVLHPYRTIHRSIWLHTVRKTH